MSVALGACASGGSSRTGPIPHPVGDALIFRINTEGGFVAPETVVTHVPEFSLMGDGRVIVAGAIDMIFPGPAMAPLLQRTLNEDGIQAVLRMIADTGMFTQDRELRGGMQHIADAPTTTFTLHADGRDVIVSAYALGMLDQLPADEAAAQRSLLSLQQRLSTVDSALPASAWTETAWHAFGPSALRLFVRNADADPPDPSGIANQLLPWPTANDPAALGGPSNQLGQCVVVTGADASAWLRVLAQANQLTRFVAGTHRYAVRVAGLLPDEPPRCPPAQAGMGPSAARSPEA